MGLAFFPDVITFHCSLFRKGGKCKLQLRVRGDQRTWGNITDLTGFWNPPELHILGKMPLEIHWTTSYACAQDAVELSPHSGSFLRASEEASAVLSATIFSLNVFKGSKAVPRLWIIKDGDLTHFLNNHLT